MNQYEVIVIGSGTGGQTAAYDLNAAGLNVALVDNSPQPGGICAIAGCQAKKYFYEVAEIIARSRHLASKGITTPAGGDWSAVWKQKEAFTSRVPENTVKGLFGAGIEFIKGRAVFKDANTLDVDGRELKAGYFVVATGAKPAPLPIQGVEHLIDSTEFLARSSMPQRIVFVGGGFISFEFAHFVARIGPENRKVTILEVADRPLSIFDHDMVDLLLQATTAEGIEVKTSSQISAIKPHNGAYMIELASGPAIETDLVVHGASRVPDIQGLNLGAIGIEHTARGIQVNSDMQTTLPHIFAVGDCAATVALARVADYEAHTAAHNIVRISQGDTSAPRQVDYAAVPAVLFSYPQYAMVGRTEQDLKQAGITYYKSMATGLGWPTYRRIGMTHAGYKILVAENNTILGAHIISDNATGLINIFRQAIIDGATAEDMHRNNIMTPYPSRESDIIYMLNPLIE